MPRRAKQSSETNPNETTRPTTSGSRKRQQRRRRIEKIKPIGQLAAAKRAAKEMKESLKSSEAQDNPSGLVINQNIASSKSVEPHYGHTLSEVWNLNGDEEPDEVEDYKLTYVDERTGEKIPAELVEDEYDYPRPEANEI